MIFHHKPVPSLFIPAQQPVTSLFYQYMPKHSCWHLIIPVCLILSTNLICSSKLSKFNPFTTTWPSKDYCFVCLGAKPSHAWGITPERALGTTYGAGVEPQLTLCKTSVLPTVPELFFVKLLLPGS